MTKMLTTSTQIRHPDHGPGEVIVAADDTVVARFGGAIHQVLRADVEVIRSLADAIESRELDNSAETLLRARAVAIRSVNDQWGVFSRSRIQLLPHQLWVCHKVNGTWPFRWLVADDVGLGKTIEAGLVLMPLIATGRVRRLLILAPAKLVPQWQARMKKMFDIRLQIYDRAIDTDQTNFWDTASMVVASMHTLRSEINPDRVENSRFLQADAWDAVIVDEAHHANADERMGETLSFQLLRALEERQRMNSLVLFTGTPHRGKDFGFFSLLSLLDPSKFGPDKDVDEQLASLPGVMIRNNKAMVTDLEGNKLFTPVSVDSEEYKFSECESQFYRTMSEFIIDGRAYASSMSGRAQTARMLLLIALQKLAASSIAAIRSALTKRRARLAETAQSVRGARAVPGFDDERGETLDDQAEREEEAAGQILVELMEGEIARIDELLVLAEPIVHENKINSLVDLIEGRLPANEPVLLFTEYKATQALVVDALHARFGHGCCAFINGDERLDSVNLGDGKRGPKSWSRDKAADAFNSGDVRFLVSTEAAGEGIDLQERCATLVHVDLPWNPMRMHQRVGRLSRYGQTRPVQVYILRNPDTVEARIWDLLNQKLERIQGALNEAMEDREDIGQLVLGMASTGDYERIFAGSADVRSENLKEWFDKEAATIGGEDVVRHARQMFGNVARFDFGQVGEDVPKVDLTDLERFFSSMMDFHGRRVMKREDGLRVKTPEGWAVNDFAMRDEYEGLVFDRNASLGRQGMNRLVGVGHTLFDRALAEGEKQTGVLAFAQRLDHPLLICAIEDEITGQNRSVERIIVGVQQDERGDKTILRDWELLQKLNTIGRDDQQPAKWPGPKEELADKVKNMMGYLGSLMGRLGHTMTRPRGRPIMMILPTTC